MLRITVFGEDGSWSFCPGAEANERWESAFRATQAAVAYGNTQHDKVPGYIVRLLVHRADSVTHSVALETHVFGADRTEVPPSDHER